MFCPNCGQDCRDAKFCTGCGTQLQQAVAQESKKAAWAVGTPCPYCGGVGLNGNCCAFCGVQLIADTHEGESKRKPVFPKPPLGIYRNSRSEQIEITEDAIVFKVQLDILNYASWKRTAIPFEEIINVTLVPGDFFTAGFLSVRRKQDKYNPIPKGISDVFGDPISICFRMRDYKAFSTVYDFLKQCAAIVNAAEVKSGG